MKMVEAKVHPFENWRDAEFVVVTMPDRGLTKEQYDARLKFIQDAIDEKIVRDRDA